MKSLIGLSLLLIILNIHASSVPTPQIQRIVGYDGGGEVQMLLPDYIDPADREAIVGVTKEICMDDWLYALAEFGETDEFKDLYQPQVVVQRLEYRIDREIDVLILDMKFSCTVVGYPIYEW